jgi:hypothetical protein
MCTIIYTEKEGDNMKRKGIIVVAAVIAVFLFGSTGAYAADAGWKTEIAP